MGARHRTSTTAAGAAILLSLAAGGGIIGAQAAGASTSGRTPLPGSAVTASARQHAVGAVAKSAQVDFEVVLKLHDASGAESLVRAISSPGSASYRHYLTASQWESQFSPTTSEVSSARAWLASEGFTVGAVSKDRITISASGTAAQVEKAFGTTLNNYKLHGHTVRMAASTMSVPASISGTVAGALGINQNIATPASAAGTAASSRASAPAATNPFPPAPAAFITAPPCGSYYGAKTATVTPPFGQGYANKAPYQVCGYKPGQFRSSYDIGSANTGKGVTVAVIDAYGSSTIASDATRYFKMNDPGNPFANAHFSQLNAIPFANEAECAASGWATEQAIDVESVHSMAPNAHVLYVGAKDCLNGLFNAEQTVIDNRLADVVTNSWGDDAGDLLDDVATKTAYDDLFMLADSTGMSILFSSGDNGDNFNLFGFSSADYPTESPYVTSVGGTSLKIGANGQQTGQLGWATGRSWKCTANVVGGVPGCTKSAVGTWLPVTYDGGSGGFTSYNYTQPYYQAGVVPSALALRNEALDGPSPMRVDPDISMDADPATGFLIGLHETFPNGAVQYGQTRYGGTSLASPLLAGVIADTDQAAGTSVGFINPAIYKLDATAGVIDDILPGGKQAQVRVDHANTYVTGATGYIQSFRELTYEGVITYCDATGNCATRPNTLSTASGYDSMTGLGSIGPDFVTDLAQS
ncbi:MAG: protease pro-enzyme activation domain-containing protein [Streptosporangiaceae bacterium]